MDLPENKTAASTQRSSSLSIALNPKSSFKNTNAKETALSLITHSISRNPQSPEFFPSHVASFPERHLPSLTNLSATNPCSFKEEKEAPHKKEIQSKRKIQIHFAPSISYRVMYVGTKPLFSNAGSEPESQVGHLPATGFEAGIAVSRPVAKRWVLRTGVQFNFSRYKINAAKEQTDWVYLNLYARNNSMLSSDQEVKKQQLMNENLQVSFPIAMEYRVLENRCTSLLLAASIQPSWVLHASGHMISTNYNKYVPVENLYRKYNVNGGIECLVNIKAGLIDFQAGPQIRYQLLSNTTGSYPVKEHLVDYGFKVGITKGL